MRGSKQSRRTTSNPLSQGTRRRNRGPIKPLIVAIAGGSGSGKSWLAEQLEQALAPKVVRLSLDNFYLDRSHLTPLRRADLNFDHPRAIDWHELEKTLKCLVMGHPAEVPLYDFQTHSRTPARVKLKPKPVLLLEGLWTLRRASIRRLVSMSVFLHCPAQLRLSRRVARDQSSRGRTRAAIKEQFRKTVEPMHRLFVEPQALQADIVIRRACDFRRVDQLADRVRALLAQNGPDDSARA